MKKAIVIAALLFSGLVFQKASAQVSIHVNIGSQPVWGPTGYDYVDYYYLPDIDAYYYVPRHQYIYEDRGRWIYASSLPPRYGDYDIYNSYKVVINEPKPYLHADVYRTRYASYKGRHDQEIIRNSRDSKYYVIKDHPEHGKWAKEHKNNGHHRR